MRPLHDIRFEQVQKRYGSFTAIEELNLKIKSGERLVLLGPSGCGKSTIMRLIAGLEKPTGGVIYMGGQPVNEWEPEDRNVAMVFQNYALYPHMTVFDNIAFSLRLKKMAKAEIQKRVREAAALMEIDHLLERKPVELSGGQRQRVALSRALVRMAPYFLLDEPLSNLDAILRVNARNDLIELHQRMPTTMVYVTHDQIEAMTIGQRIAVLNRGQLQQIGTPEEVYRFPANQFVARFIGNPPMNLWSACISNERLLLLGQPLALPEGWLSELKRELHGNDRLVVGIRPEAIRVEAEGPPSGWRAGIEGTGWLTDGQKGSWNEWSVSVRYLRSEYLGSTYVHHFERDGQRIEMVSPVPLKSSAGEHVTLYLSLNELHFFRADGDGQRIILLPVFQESQERVAVRIQ